MESVAVVERPASREPPTWRPNCSSASTLLTDQLVRNILAGDFSYTEGTLLTLEQLTVAVRDNLFSLLSTLSGRGQASLDAARAAGRLKARQGVPLAALLHAYRLAGRLIWAELVALAQERDSAESLVHLASDVWAVIDEYSGAAADAYREYTAEQARQDADSRGIMFTALLDGTVDTGPRSFEIVRMLNLGDRAGYSWSAPRSATRAPTHARIGSDCAPGASPRPGSAAAGRHGLGLLGVPAGRMLETLVPAPRWPPAPAARVGISRPFGSPERRPRARLRGRARCERHAAGAAPAASTAPSRRLPC